MKRDVCQMQNWVFLDPDAKVQQLYNVLVFSDNELVAYNRLVPVGLL